MNLTPRLCAVEGRGRGRGVDVRVRVGCGGVVALGQEPPCHGVDHGEEATPPGDVTTVLHRLHKPVKKVSRKKKLNRNCVFLALHKREQKDCV